MSAAGGRPAVTSAAEILVALEAATAAAFAFARATMVAANVRTTEDEDWARLPSGKGRCPVSRWSRSTILRHIDASHIRGKRLRGARFYSLQDVRNYLHAAPTEAAV